jgi:hypothetical protein
MRQHSTPRRLGAHDLVLDAVTYAALSGEGIAMVDDAGLDARKLLEGTTPGPWIIPTDAAYVIDFRRTSPIHYAVFHTDGPDEERQANARLCAAAPDLARENIALREAMGQWAEELNRGVPPNTVAAAMLASIGQGKG